MMTEADEAADAEECAWMDREHGRVAERRRLARERAALPTPSRWHLDADDLTTGVLLTALVVVAIATFWGR